MENTPKQSILLVDDDSANQDDIKRVLKDLDLNVIIAESTTEVPDLIRKHDFALIFFGVTPSNLTPFETAIDLDKNEKTWYIPIIFQAESEHVSGLFEKGYAAGGVDFLHKPVRPKPLLAKVKAFLELNARQQQLVVATASIQEQNLKLEERAIRDSLTGLFNHNYLQEQLAREVSAKLQIV